MEGILLSIDRSEGKGKVDPRNDRLGVLTIYFGKQIPDDVAVGRSVEFEVRISAAGNSYAKFTSAVSRNPAVFNTEARELWYTWGEDHEKDFIENVVPALGIDLRKNPEKETCPWAIDLFDFTRQRYADLKVQQTPFFTCGSKKYSYCEKPYDPTYTVVFNKKDYESYCRDYPDCDIYFWVNWKQLKYTLPNGRSITVQPLKGVWRASFSAMRELIQKEKVSLHTYEHRKDDDHNAKESFLFMLTDETVFTKLL